MLIGIRNYQLLANVIGYIVYSIGKIKDSHLPEYFEIFLFDTYELSIVSSDDCGVPRSVG